MATDRHAAFRKKIEEVIQGEYARQMMVPGDPVSKFMLIALAIEYLGACLDRQHLKSTSRAEKRFNLAINKLFPVKYHHFAKAGSIPNLYRDFRCPIVHRFEAEQTIILTALPAAASTDHLTYQRDGKLVLVAEDFYTDLLIASRQLFNILEKQ